jgi:hypothetical protein
MQHLRNTYSFLTGSLGEKYIPNEELQDKSCFQRAHSKKYVGLFLSKKAENNVMSSKEKSVKKP